MNKKIITIAVATALSLSCISSMAWADNSRNITTGAGATTKTPSSVRQTSNTNYNNKLVDNLTIPSRSSKKTMTPKEENKLGVSYLSNKDYSKAAYWLKKAAEQGYAVAENNLGIAYDNGQGVPKDYSKAVYWWRKAAEQGNTTAQANLNVLMNHR